MQNLNNNNDDSDYGNTTFLYEIHANNTKYYCKVIEHRLRMFASYTFQFGGKNTFCFTASMDKEHNFQPYIDRVEYKEKCLKHGHLAKSGGTIQLVKAALFTMKVLFNHIQKFTLIDDSYINCMTGDNSRRISLAFDSLIKYNKTWYERNFKAQLPGVENDKTTSLGNYKQSLKILDESIEPYFIIKERLPFIEKYKDIYEISKTPREFINNIRNKYNTDYCFELDSWLYSYIQYLHIQLEKDKWFINIQDVEKPANYDLILWKKPFEGGWRRYIHTRRRRHIQNNNYTAPSVFPNWKSYYEDEG